MLKLMSLAVLFFTLLTVAAMGAIVAFGGDERAVASAPAARGAGAVREPPAPALPAAPLLVLPAPVVGTPGAAQAKVQVTVVAPAPVRVSDPAERAPQLLAHRETRRASALDQLNAREALRRQRLGLPAPASAVATRPSPPHAPERGSP